MPCATATSGCARFRMATEADNRHGASGPSAWVQRFAAMVPSGGAVLDVAAGSGRHSRLFLEQGHRVVAVDRDPGRLRDIDGVVVATPDHTHAAISMAAIRAGKHVYCQKPLTHDVYESRMLARRPERPRSPRNWVTRATRRTTSAGPWSGFVTEQSAKCAKCMPGHEAPT